jgi:Potassium-transporting ATPase A subunit
LLYAYTSAAATNGSAFAGLNANTIFFNLTLALAEKSLHIVAERENHAPAVDYELNQALQQMRR